LLAEFSTRFLVQRETWRRLSILRGKHHRMPGGAGTGRGSEGRPAAHLAREGNPEVRTVPPSEGEEAQTTGAPPDFALAGRTYRWSWQIRTE
jgi:hypothetical protein